MELYWKMLLPTVSRWQVIKMPSGVELSRVSPGKLECPLCTSASASCRNKPFLQRDWAVGPQRSPFFTHPLHFYTEPSNDSFILLWCAVIHCILQSPNERRMTGLIWNTVASATSVTSNMRWQGFINNNKGIMWQKQSFTIPVIWQLILSSNCRVRSSPTAVCSQFADIFGCWSS